MSLVEIDQNFIRISVVIPAYNRAGTISGCLKSVLGQTFKPFEVIVVDDCSTDNTVEIVRRFNDPLVRCIVLERNSGAQSARNRGIREARGNWIAFQDSDDEWLPEKLEKQCEALARVNFCPDTLVHCNATLLDTATGHHVDDDMPLIEGEDVYSLLLAKPGPMFPAMLVSRQVLGKINYLDEQVPSHQEWDTAIRLAQCCRFIHLREKLFVYRVNRDDTISRDATRGIEGYRYVIDKHHDDIIRFGGEELWMKHQLVLIRKALDGRLWEVADSYLAEVPVLLPKALILKCCRFLQVRPTHLLSIYEPIVQILCRQGKRFS